MPSHPPGLRCDDIDHPAIAIEKSVKLPPQLCEIRSFGQSGRGHLEEIHAKKRTSLLDFAVEVLDVQ